jgi:NAD(P)-dependent dehydrogenase (short-subunit alcohol dehydrogenase family)
MKSKLGLIVGGSGALGKSVVSVFKRRGWSLLNIDIHPNTEADINLVLDSNKKI